MATSAKIHLRPEDVGSMNFGKQSQETAEKTSEFLQKNHNKHHIFFNDRGFHNHIVHQTLTLYGVGAPFSIISREYDRNTAYQRPQYPVEERIIEDMSDVAKFKQFLGNEKYYQDFLVFFQREMDENKEGWEGVLKEFLLKGDERADDLLVRTFAGLMHPLIHLGFGIEFNQPAIIAEALAQAACHGNALANYYFQAEKAAAKNNSSSSPSLVKLLGEIKADKKLSTAVEWADENKIRDGTMARAFNEITEYASKWTVDKNGGEKELEKKTVEMIQAAIYFTAGSQRPPKQVKFDFFYMHSVTPSIFFPTINALSSLTLSQKARLLEWKVRTDLLNYASRGPPTIHLSELTNYTPKNKNQNTTNSSEIWKDIFNRALNHEDDGHVIKLVRAIRFGKEVSGKYEEEGVNDWIVIKGDTWEKIGNMAIDSVTDGGMRWVRSCGFEEAWENFADRGKESGVRVKEFYESLPFDMSKLTF